MKKLVDELEKVKNTRHNLRCEIINYIRDNIDRYPVNTSTGFLGHQLSRKRVLTEKIYRNHLGDICDKELIKDARILINEIGE